MKVKSIHAAILTEINKPLEITNIQPTPLLKGQILVKIFYSGVCRSQLMEVKGHRGKDKWTPHLLGHEGSGVVIDCHESITKFKIGDEVILTWIKSKGEEAKEIFFNKDGKRINAGHVTTFSNYSVVSENRVVIKPKNLSFDKAMLFGCAIPTGAGMMMNQIKPSTEDSVLILGLGGIGLSALIMSLALGVKKIAVIDVNKSKLDQAKSLGVNFLYHGNSKNIKNEVLVNHTDGFDFCVESAGLTETIELGFELINSQKGQLYFASHPPNGEKIKLNPHDLISGKKIFGSWGGATNPDEDIPKMWSIINNSSIDLEFLITKTYNLENINDAIDDINKGKVFRPLIKMKH
jgi:S-(hydroxymethyl)glutathione dehydrogenase/alcohol dehydrogenase